MFAIALQPLERLLPKPAFGDLLRRWLTARSSEIDIDQMSDSWKRDVGILDGRDRYEPVPGSEMKVAGVSILRY